MKGVSEGFEKSSRYTLRSKEVGMKEALARLLLPEIDVEMMYITG